MGNGVLDSLKNDINLILGKKVTYLCSSGGTGTILVIEKKQRNQGLL